MKERENLVLALRRGVHRSDAGELVDDFAHALAFSGSSDTPRNGTQTVEGQ